MLEEKMHFFLALKALKVMVISIQITQSQSEFHALFKNSDSDID